MLDDVYRAADNHSRSLLLQLDLSAAFDTLDKTTLHRLDHTLAYAVHHTSGSTPTLTDTVSMSESVITSCRQSAAEYGIPQGNVLGPLLFTIYTSPIINVITPFKVVHYAQRHSTLYHTQHQQGPQCYRRPFPVSEPLVGR